LDNTSRVSLPESLSGEKAEWNWGILRCRASRIPSGASLALATAQSDRRLSAATDPAAQSRKDYRADRVNVERLAAVRLGAILSTDLDHTQWIAARQQERGIAYFLAAQFQSDADVWQLYR
jgi:hypothetical protein